MEKMISKAFNKQQSKITNQHTNDQENQCNFIQSKQKNKTKNLITNGNEHNQNRRLFKLNRNISDSSSFILTENNQSKPVLDNVQVNSNQEQPNKRSNSKRKNLNKKTYKFNLNENHILRNILGKVNCANTPLYEPLNEEQYLKYLHLDGRIRCLRELRLAIYRRGIKPSLRSTLWKHLLNAYPPHLTSEQRVRFIQHHSEEYYQLCYTWQTNFQHPKVQAIHNQVRKDVLRTDRSHPFYTCKVNLDLEANNDITSSASTYSSILTQLEAKNEDYTKFNFSHNSLDISTLSSLQNAGNNNNVGVYENRNVQALTNILTTYALNHKIGYWQGMSDLCSPILLAIQNEPDTYICFVALMRRLSANFNGDQHMAKKFELLRRLVQYYDPELYEYLLKNQANDLLFCYRWLLLELKREFKLDSVLYMLEVSWAAMPPIFYNNLTMYDTRFNPYESELKSNSNLEEKNFIDQNKKLVTNIDDILNSNEHNSNGHNSNEHNSNEHNLVEHNSNEMIDFFDSHQQTNSTIIPNSKLFFKNSPVSLFKNLSTSSSTLEQNHLQNNLKQLKNDVASAASNLGKQVTAGMSQVMHGMANVANEIYENFNSTLISEESSKSLNECKNFHKSSHQNPTFKRLKVTSSVEDYLIRKRERFQKNNNNHNSISSLNETRTSMLENDFNNSDLQTSSLNNSYQSLFECNTNLNCILSRTQRQLKQQQADQLQSYTEARNKLNLNSNSSNKLNKQLITKRHIRFLPKILSTDSNDNAIDSPDADDLNETYKFPHLIDKQYSVDSIESLDCSNDFKSISSLLTRSSNVKNVPLHAQQVLSHLSSLNSSNNSHGALKIKQIYLLTHPNVNTCNLQQHSLPNSPLLKKKLDFFGKTKLFTSVNSTKNVANNETNVTKNYYNNNNQFDSIDQTELFVHCNGEHAEQSNSYNWTPERGLLNCFNNSQSFDSLSNSGTFLPNSQILSSTVTSTNTVVNNSSNFGNALTNSHPTLAQQLSDKIINDKMYTNRQNINEENQNQFKNNLNKKHLFHTQSSNNMNNQKICESNVTISQSIDLNTSKIIRSDNNNKSSSLSEQLSKLNLTNNNFLSKLSNNSNEKEEKSEGYCSGSVSDRNSNYEEQLFTGGESMINTFSKLSSCSVCLSASSSSSTSSPCSPSSMKSSISSSSSSSLSCSSSFIILSSNASFKAKASNIEKPSSICLPNPAELSSGNAFMLFICLTILLQHRDKLINDQLDANEIAIYFDNYVRKHDVDFVLNTARELFQNYLNKWHSFQLSESKTADILCSTLDEHNSPQKN